MLIWRLIRALFRGRACPVLRIRTRVELIRFLTRDPDEGTVEMVVIDVRAMREEGEEE